MKWDEPLDESDDYAAPHCDQSILHAPGECWACDLYPKRQRDRENQRINFTNEHDETKAPCPSEHFRSGELRDRWPNNVAKKNPDDPPHMFDFTALDGEPRMTIVSQPRRWGKSVWIDKLRRRNADDS